MGEANTISIKVYTPGGGSGFAVFAFENGELPYAADIDRKIAERGFLFAAPGALPGEELETITHVILRIQHNKSDGSQTPCVGMYYENPKLVYCKKAYLNTPEDIATFERLSGLKLAQLPKFPGQFPKRDDLSAQEFIIPAKTPFQIRMVDGTYTDDSTGEVKPTKVFAGFYDPTGTPQAAQTGSSTPGTASGNTGTGGNVIQGQFAPPEKTWEEQVFEATAFLYDHPNHQTNSINALLKNGKIKDTDKPALSIIQLLMHRAMADYGIDESEFKKTLGGNVSEYMKSVRGDYKAAWNTIVRSQTPPLAATGTDSDYPLPPVDMIEIPF